MQRLVSLRGWFITVKTVFGIHLTSCNHHYSVPELSKNHTSEIRWDITKVGASMTSSSSTRVQKRKIRILLYIEPVLFFLLRLGPAIWVPESPLVHSPKEKKNILL